MIATPGEPPYYAVVFTSVRTPGDQGYAQMEQLAAQQPGFLGLESARGQAGLGITVSYWSSPEAIAGSRKQVDHLGAQRLGRARWYQAYAMRVAKVERAATFEAH